MRLDAPLWFANAQYVVGWLLDLIVRNENEEQPKGAEAIKWVIWDLSPVTYIDTTGVQELTYLLKDFQIKGVQLVLANPHGSVLRTLERGGIVGTVVGASYDDPAVKPDAGDSWVSELPLVSGAVGRQWVFAASNEAVAVVLKAKQAGYVPQITEHTFKVRAPLNSVCAPSNSVLNSVCAPSNSVLNSVCAPSNSVLNSCSFSTAPCSPYSFGPPFLIILPVV